MSVLLLPLPFSLAATCPALLCCIAPHLPDEAFETKRRRLNLLAETQLPTSGHDSAFQLESFQPGVTALSSSERAYCTVHGWALSAVDIAKSLNPGSPKQPFDHSFITPPLPLPSRSDTCCFPHTTSSSRFASHQDFAFPSLAFPPLLHPKPRPLFLPRRFIALLVCSPAFPSSPLRLERSGGVAATSHGFFFADEICRTDYLPHPLLALSEIEP